MKKLFFTALVAVVAVGGVFASNSNFFSFTYWTIGQFGPPNVDCSGTSGDLCISIFTGLYDGPWDDPYRINIIDSLTNSQYYMP